MTPYEKGLHWTHAVEAWKSGGALTDFMLGQIATLRDADGDSLPEIAREFLLDLVQWRLKKPRKPGPRSGPRSETIIREEYRRRLFLEQCAGGSLPGESPHDRAIWSMADDLGMSEAAVSQIVHPRRSRKPRNPGQNGRGTE